jgi:hypothetical protein
LTELEKEQAVRDVRELIISSGITASVLRIVPGENLYGSDDQEYAQIATMAFRHAVQSFEGVLRSQHRVYDGRGEVARTQDVWGAEGISGRVKFLPLTWQRWKSKK